jgi:hypothetical protein
MHILQNVEEKKVLKAAPLMLASMAGKTTEVERLLEEGEDIMVVDKVS